MRKMMLTPLLIITAKFEVVCTRQGYGRLLFFTRESSSILVKSPLGLQRNLMQTLAATHIPTENFIPVRHRVRRI